MGAVAPSLSWIPEDDILLKNAIEAGASLESLALGAVQFSRRFTVQELQDRWYSLLYDPIVSEEAANRMIEFENSPSTILIPNRLENRRETSCILGKRKSKSLRKCYYAMRKRISSEPFGSMGINFLSGPMHLNNSDGNEPQSANCMTENPLPDDFDFQDPNFDFTDRSFQEFATCDVEPTGHGVTPSVNDHVEHLPFNGNDDSQSFCPMSEKDISLPENHNEFPLLGQSENLDANVTSEFEGTSFQDFGYSSPSPQMPMWSAIEGIFEPTLPFQFEDKHQQTGDSFLFPNGGDANTMPRDNTNNLTDSTKEYFEQLSSTLFDFTNEELQLMDADGNDTIDKSYFDGFSSLLLDSPNFSVSEGSLTPDGQIPIISTIPCPIDRGKGPFHPDNQTCVPKADVSTIVSRVKLFGPEFRDGIICCTLNTEDQEVPSNDDVFLPFRCPSPSYPTGANWRLHDGYYPLNSAGRDFTSTQKVTGGPSLMKNERKESSTRPQILGLPRQSDMGLKHKIRDHRVKFDGLNNNTQNATVKNVKNEGLSHASSLNAAIVGKGKNLDQSTSVSCLNRHMCRQDSLKIPIECKKEVHATVPNNGEVKAVLSSMEMVGREATEQNSLSDEEELYSESDFEVPYFSDVEAMILDMDLSPDDSAWQSSQKVLRYQDNETKRTIIRLEQAADAHMQRAMTARGALAVLYGRRLKHFIKKPQVLLGRSTEDFEVDIDLGREGRANKISRRQAIIEMDLNGVFRLKNLGKFSIHVNGKEVAPKQSINLTSGCLIEVKRLSFVFESR